MTSAAESAIQLATRRMSYWYGKQKLRQIGVADLEVQTEIM